MKTQVFLKPRPDQGSTVRILILGSSCVTLAFWSTFQDPFNSLKLSLILITAAWVFGHIISNRKLIFSFLEMRSLITLCFLFLFFLLISSILTDNKKVAFIGESQRNNGFLMYFGLTIILIVASQVTKFNQTLKFFKAGSYIGAVLAVYGLFQINGVDFVRWNNPYNAVISTLGNPNFAAAIMAMLATLMFGTIFNNSFSRQFRTWCLIVCVLLVLAIYSSNARQGLIGIALGFGILITVLVHSKHRLLGFSFLFLGVIVGGLSILGMLQSGPLSSILYKGSVTVRGYYWRAGIEMFKDNPIFGVGIDRYGAYFKQYREVEYPLNYGFNITSSNAHNLPIQFFATGGVFVGMLYLLIIGFIAWRAIILIKSSHGNKRLIVTTFFSSWMVYQATNFISIDSPGVAIWGWLIGGVIVGLSVQDQEAISQTKFNKLPQNLKKSAKIDHILISTTAVAAALMFSLILFRGETNMFYTRAVYNSQNPANNVILKASATKTINHLWVNQVYQITAANFLANSGFPREGITELEKIYSKDSRSDDTLMLLALYYAQLNQLDLAIASRLKISELDPWNAANYLELGRLYKRVGNIEKMNETRKKIQSFAQSTPEGELASIELIN